MFCPYCLEDVKFELRSPSASSGLSDDTSGSSEEESSFGGSNPGRKYYHCPMNGCRRRIPAMYVTDYHRYPPIVASAVGFRGHGKTVFFASLFHAIRHEGLMQQWPNFHSLALDDPSLKRVIGNVSMIERGKLPESTQKGNFVRPTLVRMADAPGLQSCTLSVYDTSGEAFTAGEAVEQYAKFVARAGTVLFLVSIPGLLEQGGDHSSALDKLLGAYIMGCHELGTETKYQDLVVVYTKADDLARYLNKWPQLQSYIRADSFEGLANAPQYVNRMYQVSQMLNQLTEHGLKARNFLHTARANFRSVNFALVSSLGSTPDADNNMTVALAPRRVLDPLLFLMAGGPYQPRQEQAGPPEESSGIWERLKSLFASGP